jgi:hypothetical protein
MNDLPQLPTYSDEDLAELSPSKLTDILIEDQDRVPRNVIDECARRGDKMTEYLDIQDDDDFLWSDDDSDGVWWLRHHAACILGLIPSEQAGLKLVELMRNMAQEDDDMQDWLAGYWTALFLNKPHSVLPALIALCEDREIDEHMRANAIETVIAAAARQGGEKLEQALAWVAGMANDEDDEWEFRLSAASMLLYFPREKYRPLLEDLAEQQGGFMAHFSAGEVQQAYAGKYFPPEWERFTDPWEFYEPDAITKRQKRWREEDEKERQRNLNKIANKPANPYVPYVPQETYIRPEPKIGRNDHCPCGSGKKYKQCCLKAEQSPPEDDFLWRRIRRAIEGSPAKMLEFSSSHFGPEALLEAWDEFMPPWDDKHDEPFAPDTPHMPIFMPWFFYDWTPDPLEASVKHEALDGRTLARAYLDKKGRYLDPLLVRYMEQCCIAPFSFYDVLSVQPGEGFVLRDIMTGEEIKVTEQAGSHHTQAGDIMFAKLAKIDQVTMLEACAPVMFPPIEKSAILELRKEIQNRRLAFTPELLKEFTYEMLDIYHDITDRLLNPAMPQLQNTDGDPLVFNKLIYRLECAPREALDNLRQLNLTEDDESILTGAEFAPSGELRKIGFAWEKSGNQKHKEWDNTILGHIMIEENRLTAEVNSENRAQKFKALMEKLLPGKARYKTTVIQSPQAMLARSEEEGETARSKQIRKEQEELNSRPEVQAKIAELMRQHYRKWPSQKLPALNGKTPLQATKTNDGKEMVEALLMEFEQRGKHTTPPLDPAIIAELRERLGLPREEAD